jgi:fatty acid desaturase
MYTNTPWDNHFRGMDPFIKTDPTVERNFFQGSVAPFINPVILTFGLYGNYIAHLVALLKGQEVPSIGKVLMPLQMFIMIYTWGWHGFRLMYTCHAVVSLYYFTLALMNHNAEHCTDTSTRNQSRDWGEAQLHSSADWGVNLSFLQAFVYLWLNYHTVHHMFPRVDFSHHPAIQHILIETCKEFNVKYVTSDPITIYKQMIRSFSTPSSLMKEIIVNAGGI